jgi:mRNA interferase MazF
VFVLHWSYDGRDWRRDSALDADRRPTSTSAQPAIFRPEIEMEGVRTRVLIDQMRAVDASRLGELAGRLDAAETGEVDRAMRLMLGIL